MQISDLLVTLQPQTTQKDMANLIDNNLLKEKAAEGYMPCLNNSCVLREHCLHWLVGCHLPEKLLVVSTVNPSHPDVANGKCSLYKDATPQRLPYGMMHIFDNIPHAKAVPIKRQLIGQMGRTFFYRLRKGTQPIPPYIEQDIAAAFRQHGCQEPPQYDRYEEGYLW